MANDKEARVYLTNTQLKKLKSAEKYKTGKWILRMNKEKVEDEETPNELFLTATQTTKIRYAFTNKTSTDIKLSKVLC